MEFDLQKESRDIINIATGKTVEEIREHVLPEPLVEIVTRKAPSSFPLWGDTEGVTSLDEWKTKNMFNTVIKIKEEDNTEETIMSMSPFG